MARDKVQIQRDTDAHKVRKNIEEREARRESKHRKAMHYQLDVEDDVEVDSDTSYDYYIK